MIAWIAAVLVGQISSSEVESLVRDLGHEVLEVRERAHRKLLEAGAAALPALNAAANSNDAELRLRAAAIAEIVGRAGREKVHDDAQKAELLRGQVGEAEKCPGSAASEGARFDLDVSAFEGGWVIRTFATDRLSRRKDAGPGQGRLAFDVQVLDSQGNERVVDKCAKCSPKKVFVRGTNVPMKVRVLGSQTWFSPYELVFKNPIERQSRKVGDFTIEVIAGGLTVSSPTDFPYDWIRSMIANCAVDLKPGLPPPRRPSARTLIKRLAPREEPVRLSWCDCPRGPEPPPPSPGSPRIHSFNITMPIDWNATETDCNESADRPYTLADYASLKYTFWKPITLPIDVTVDLIPAKPRD